MIVKTKYGKISVKSKSTLLVQIVRLRLLSDTALTKVWLRAVATLRGTSMILMDTEVQIVDGVITIDPPMPLPADHPVVFDLGGYSGEVEVELKGLPLAKGETMKMRTADGPTALGLFFPPLGG